MVSAGVTSLDTRSEAIFNDWRFCLVTETNSLYTAEISRLDERKRQRIHVAESQRQFSMVDAENEFRCSMRQATTEFFVSFSSQMSKNMWG
jgi:hypothetical protein